MMNEKLYRPRQEEEDPFLPAEEEDLPGSAEEQDLFFPTEEEDLPSSAQEESAPLPVSRPPKSKDRLSHPPRAKGRRSRWKLVGVAVAGLLVLAVVLGILTQASGSGAVQTTGSRQPASTPKPASTPLSHLASPTPK